MSIGRHAAELPGPARGIDSLSAGPTLVVAGPNLSAAILSGGPERLVLLADDRELQELRELLDRAVLDASCGGGMRQARRIPGRGGRGLRSRGHRAARAVDRRLGVAVGADRRRYSATTGTCATIEGDRIPIIKRQGYATDFDIADAATMRREPFYTELLAPQKIGNFIGLNIEVGRQTWIASVERGSDAAAAGRGAD